jgi:hypothetical protein
MSNLAILDGTNVLEKVFMNLFRRFQKPLRVSVDASGLALRSSAIRLDGARATRLVRAMINFAGKFGKLRGLLFQRASLSFKKYMAMHKLMLAITGSSSSQ